MNQQHTSQGNILLYDQCVLTIPFLPSVAKVSLYYQFSVPNHILSHLHQLTEEQLCQVITVLRTSLTPINHKISHHINITNCKQVMIKIFTAYLTHSEEKNALLLSRHEWLDHEQFIMSPYKKQILKTIATIPYQTVASYQDIARQAGYPGSARAVGQVCRHNPLPLLIPCHRVIRVSGFRDQDRLWQQSPDQIKQRLGSYQGGAHVKYLLLLSERLATHQTTQPSLNSDSRDAKVAISCFN
ncbi:MAG: MGMT family protein [Proteobacteria bacterium]|nr:MGMT family protein [Pseudomonadota bacterium]